MKKVILVFTLATFCHQVSKAQNWVPTGSNDLVTDNATNNVGIGTSTPPDKLTVQDGNLSMPNTNDKAIRVITAHSPRGMFYFGTDVQTQAPYETNGPLIQMGGVENSWRPGQIWYHSYAESGEPSWGNSHMFLNFNKRKNNWTSLLAMRDVDGYAKVTVGTVPSQPDGYSLFVQHGILTEKVKVALASSNHWADYVFAPSYSLMPLPQLEQYITANKHLPGIPAAQELVNTGGIDMNEMFSKQMAKIEELTLYVIELEKQVKELKNSATVR